LDVKLFLEKERRLVDRALSARLPQKGDCPETLRRAMAYAVMSGGKRIRPILARAACVAVGGKAAWADAPACAVEMIHAYSLVHDDLPCMDDDALRRGKPTCHVKFGEANALLAGDALLTLAFGVLSEWKKNESAKSLAIGWLAEAAGMNGMVGGQVLDLAGTTRSANLAGLRSVHSRKTGALIAASARLGALAGGGSRSQIARLFEYGKNLGFLFQIVDDILDGDGCVKILGIEAAKKLASKTASRAKRQLHSLGNRAGHLSRLTDYVLNRSS